MLLLADIDEYNFANAHTLYRKCHQIDVKMSLMVKLEVVILTTFGAASNENVINMAFTIQYKVF